MFSKGSINHPLRPLLRSIFTWRTQAQCRHACAVRYVSSHLQARYAPNPSAFQIAVSDVHLPMVALVRAPRRIPNAPTPLRLIAIGSLEQPYKGIDVLLRALRLCFDQGFDCRLVVVGEGRRRPALASLAARLGVDGLVDFRGILPAGERVFAALDECDLFVMPSRLEGMPRAMIEAMARALPCIGSRVGGIPELLDAENLVSPGNPADLAAKIIEVGKSPGRMEWMSRRCLERANDFPEHKLGVRTRDFLAHVRDATESWSATRLRRVEAVAA
jgi:glycosyltransferase involved in cell wall biosynthesis